MTRRHKANAGTPKVIDAASELLERLRMGRLASDAKGMTMTEIAEATGLSRARAQTVVLASIRRGTMVYAGKRKAEKVDGSPYWVPVYRVATDNRPKAGK